jgi:curli biogenesis system outer membrane secretion channel CsgG
MKNPIVRCCAFTFGPFVLLFLCTMAAHTQTAGGAPGNKKRVAVMNFDYGTVRTTVAQIFGGDQDVGRGLADLLVAKFVKDGTYAVLERRELSKVMAEQNLSNSDRADTAAAAKIGRILSVDAIIIGSITQFGRDDKTTTLGASGLSNVTNRFGIGGLQKRADRAVVGITARVVDASTGEILAVAEGKGTSIRSGTSLLGAGGAGAAGRGTYDMSSANFGQTLLGEAANQAIANLASQLQLGAQQLPTRTVAVQGLVADVSGKTLILNVGSKAGVKVGDQLEVVRKIREIKDPATGKVIRSIENKIGEVAITDIDENSAIGTYSGSANPTIGDAVKGNMSSAVASAPGQSPAAPGPVPGSGPGTSLGPKKPGVVRLGVVIPQAQMGEPDSASSGVAESVRTLIIQSLAGAAVEVTPVGGSLSAEIDAQAKEKSCDYILYSSLSQKKSGGMGFLNKAMPAANFIPTVAVMKGASSALGSAMSAAANAQAAQVAASSAAGTVKAKNDVAFEYKLMAVNNTTPLLASAVKAKAKTDGDDVISPLIQQAAASIVAELTKKK